MRNPFRSRHWAGLKLAKQIWPRLIIGQTIDRGAFEFRVDAGIFLADLKISRQASFASPTAAALRRATNSSRDIGALAKDAPELAAAIAKSAAENPSVIVTSTTQPLHKVLQAIRHEKFHGEQRALSPDRMREHLGKYTGEFLNDPVAAEPTRILLDHVYTPDDLAIEIGAHPAAGQWRRQRSRRKEYNAEGGKRVHHRDTETRRKKKKKRSEITEKRI